MRRVALKVVPLLVVAWATLAVVGGAAYLGNETEAVAAKDTAVKTGLGLCAVSVALLVSTGANRKLVMPGLATKLLPKKLVPLCSAVHPKARFRPASSDPPILQLLQVSRTQGPVYPPVLYIL